MFQYPIDKVYTSLDKVGYIDKPKDTMNIVTYNLTNSQQVISIEDFIKAKGNGHASCPVFNFNSLKKGNFFYSEMIELDFDSGITFKEVKSRLDKYNIKIGFAYNTLSNNGTNNKFRICFFLDISISSATLYEAIVKTFMAMFPECDTACKNANRIYLGGKEIIYINPTVTTERTSIASIIVGVHQYLKDTNYKKYTEKIRELAEQTRIVLSSNTLWIKERYITKDIGDKICISDITFENIPRRLINNFCATKELHLDLFQEQEIAKMPDNVIFIYAPPFNTDYSDNFKVYEFCILKNVQNIKEQSKKKEKNKEKKSTKNENSNTYELTNVKIKLDSVRNFNFEDLEHNCQYFREFKNGTKWLYYNELFPLACTFSNIEGGKKVFLNILELYKENYSSYGTRDWSNIFRNISNLCYRPENCDNFCPYHSTCKHGKNMIETVKAQRKQIVQIDMPQYISMEEMQKQLGNEMTACLEDTNKSIHLIKAQTGAGKTGEYINLAKKTNSNLVICCPTYDLINEVKERFKGEGVQIETVEELPELEDKKLEKEINTCYKLGLYAQATKLIEDCIYKLENPFGFPYKEKEIRDSKRLKEYYEKTKNITHYEGNIVITHNKLLQMNPTQLKDKIIIVDEEIFSKLLRVDIINMEDLEILNNINQTEMSQLLEKKKKKIENTNYNELIELDKIENRDRKFTEKEIKIINECIFPINSNIFSLCSSTLAMKVKSFKRIGNELIDTKKDKIYCLNRASLPECKIIILTANANKNIYERLFPDRNVILHSIGEARYKGHLYQNFTKSFSKSFITENEDSFNELQEIYEDKGFYLITFKEFSNSQDSIYFRHLLGVNNLSGKNCVVIGTPHLPSQIYLLMGYYLYGEKFNDHWSPREVEYNGYKFFLNTFKDKRLQELHLWSVESELEQAVGRARLLREDCQVHVYSNFPLKQAIFTDKSPKELLK